LSLLLAAAEEEHRLKRMRAAAAGEAFREEEEEEEGGDGEGEKHPEGSDHWDEDEDAPRNPVEALYALLANHYAAIDAVHKQYAFANARSPFCMSVHSWLLLARDTGLDALVTFDAHPGGSGHADNDHAAAAAAAPKKQTGNRNPLAHFAASTQPLADKERASRRPDRRPDARAAATGRKAQARGGVGQDGGPCEPRQRSCCQRADPRRRGAWAGREEGARGGLLHGHGQRGRQ
jgi:hypothetical protein